MCASAHVWAIQKDKGLNVFDVPELFTENVL